MTVTEEQEMCDCRRLMVKRRVTKLKLVALQDYHHPFGGFRALDVRHHLVSIPDAWEPAFDQDIPLSSCWSGVAQNPKLQK